MVPVTGSSPPSFQGPYPLAPGVAANPGGNSGAIREPWIPSLGHVLGFIAAVAYAPLLGLILVSWMLPAEPAKPAWTVPEQPLVLPVSQPVLTPDEPAEQPAPGQEWMVVAALVTAYTDHDPDAPVGPDGQPIRQTAWKQRSTVAHPYGVAADPKLLPYGSRVVLPEYMSTSFPDRAWEIEDTGGKMRQNNREHFIVHLDLRYRTTYSALKQGKQWMEISVDVTGWSDTAKERLRRAALNGQRMKDEGRLP